MISYYLAETDEAYREAAALFKEYAGTLPISLEFQQFDHELADLQEMYSSPQGGIILVRDEMEIVGCAGVRKFNERTGEIKRMYIKAAHQNKGIGRVLLGKALQLALDSKYNAVKLDTLDTMLPAIHLYQQAGFYKTAPYYHNPNANTVYFEKILV